MRSVTCPWAALKILAAGAIRTVVGFWYVLRAGAGFIIFGRSDFQVAQNVRLAADMVKRNESRDRQ